VDHTQRLILQVSTLKPHPIIDLGTLKLAHLRHVEISLNGARSLPVYMVKK
jgi:hypothetical protein